MEKFTCPMHPEIKQNEPGKCPKCGMNLVPVSQVSKHEKKDEGSYWPLFTVIGLILLIVAVVAINEGTFVWQSVMMNFMAGFFLVFSGFKLLDLKGFAEGYSTYDLLAKKVYGYGYVYPFIELGLGLAYLTRFELTITNWVTLVVMVFSSLGVAKSMLKKQKIMCACLGTFLKVPLTKVTLVEDLSMAAMALLMLAL